MENLHSYYKGYTEDQFAENHHFRQWVLHPESDHKGFWDNYLQINPDQQTVILRARQKVIGRPSQTVVQPLTTEEKSVLKNSIFQQIDKPVNSFWLSRQTSAQLLKFAAIVFGIIIVPLVIVYKNPKPVTTIVIRTGIKQIREILLPDSSVVILNANSSVIYSSAINEVKNREIAVSGNAYFKVKKKSDNRAFTVHANSISIAVTGTEFNVNARSSAVAVVLTKGKVKVSLDKNNTPAAYMVPGDKVQLDTIHKVLRISAANTILYSAWIEGKWNFSSTSLLDITNLINEYYGIETIYVNEKASRLKISALIPVTDLGALITILSKTLDLKITEYHNQLHIQFNQTKTNRYEKEI